MLSLPSEVTTLIDSGRFSIRYAVRFDLDGGAQGVWNDAYAITDDGVTYAPLAGNMSVDVVPGSGTLNSDKVIVTVSGLDPTVAGYVAGTDWHQRPCVLFLCFLDTDGTVLHMMPRFSGFLDAAELSDRSGQAATLRLTLESNNRGLNRRQGRTRSDADQRQIGGSDDGFFKNTATAVTTSETIYWGRKGPQSA